MIVTKTRVLRSEPRRTNAPVSVYRPDTSVGISTGNIWMELVQVQVSRCKHAYFNMCVGTDSLLPLLDISGAVAFMWPVRTSLAQSHE